MKVADFKSLNLREMGDYLAVRKDDIYEICNNITESILNMENKEVIDDLLTKLKALYDNIDLLRSFRDDSFEWWFIELTDQRNIYILHKKLDDRYNLVKEHRVREYFDRIEKVLINNDIDFVYYLMLAMDIQEIGYEMTEEQNMAYSRLESDYIEDDINSDNYWINKRRIKKQKLLEEARQEKEQYVKWEQENNESGTAYYRYEEWEEYEHKKNKDDINPPYPY